MPKIPHFRSFIGVRSVRDYLLPAAATFGFAIYAQIAPSGGMFCMILAASLALCALIFGRRLPLCIRVISTGVFLLLGLGMCLAGRAMAPGLTTYTSSQALLAFLSVALLPISSLLRLWPERLALSMIVASFPVCFSLAALAAHIEERMFVSQYHVTGVGPTPRWTDSNSWLSYDAQTQRLDGAD